jgi:transcriptional regulator of acetoin/glycerol metabolism
VRQVYDVWKVGKITAVAAMDRLDMKTNTFYRRVKKYETKVMVQGSRPDFYKV